MSFAKQGLMTTLGAKLVRIEFAIETPASQLQNTIAGYAAKGIRVAPLAGFYGTIPTAAQAKNLASWASMYGPGGTFWAGRSDGALAIRCPHAQLRDQRIVEARDHASRIRAAIVADARPGRCDEALDASR